MGLFLKNSPQSEGEGIFQMRTPALFGATPVFGGKKVCFLLDCGGARGGGGGGGGV